MKNNNAKNYIIECECTGPMPTLEMPANCIDDDTGLDPRDGPTTDIGKFGYPSDSAGGMLTSIDLHSHAHFQREH